LPDQEQRRQQLASFPSLIGASTGAGRSGEAWRRSRWRRAAATQLGDLPEACLAQAIALTSPRDACRCAAVSPAFRAAADSDHVWRAFLPPQLDRAKPAPVPVLQPAPASRGKKEAYLGLCDAAVGEDGGCRVWLERATGARCYALSARRLSLPWDDGEFCWKYGELAAAAEPRGAPTAAVGPRPPPPQSARAACSRPLLGERAGRRARDHRVWHHRPGRRLHSQSHPGALHIQ